jgi:hypothetical protein
MVCVLLWWSRLGVLLPIKAGKAHNTGKTKGMKETLMKWPPFLSTFVLNNVCDLTMRGVRNKKGFKEVHLNIVANKVFEFYFTKGSSQQEYNHLRKWIIGRSMCPFLETLVVHNGMMIP